MDYVLSLASKDYFLYFKIYGHVFLKSTSKFILKNCIIITLSIVFSIQFFLI